MLDVISIQKGDLERFGAEIIAPGTGRFVDILNNYIVYFMYVESTDPDVFSSLSSFADGLAVLHAWMKDGEMKYISIALKGISILVKIRNEDSPQFTDFLREITKKCEILPMQLRNTDFVYMKTETELDNLSTRFGLSLTASSHNYVLDHTEPSLRYLRGITRCSKFRKAMRRNQHLYSLLRASLDLEREHIDVKFLAQSLITVSTGFMMNSHFYGFSSDLADLETLKANEVEFDPQSMIPLGNLGAGSYGRVETCYSTDLHHVFAVKAGLSKRVSLSREYAILRELKHPTIVHAFGKIKNGEQIAIVTEMCVYGDLFKVSSLFDETQQMKIALDVIFALEYIHRAGYVWRDGKGKNVVVDFDGSAKLCDFGSACPISEAQNEIATNVTLVNQTEETREYKEFTIFTDLQMTVNFLKDMGKLSDGRLDIRSTCKEITQNIYAMRPTTSVYLSMLLRDITMKVMYERDRGVLLDRIEVLLKARSAKTDNAISEFVFNCLKENFANEFDAPYVVEYNSEAIDLWIRHVCLDPVAAKRVLDFCSELDESSKPLLQASLLRHMKELLPSCRSDDHEFVKAIVKFIREVKPDQWTIESCMYCYFFLAMKNSTALTEDDRVYGTYICEIIAKRDQSVSSYCIAMVYKEILRIEHHEMSPRYSVLGRLLCNAAQNQSDTWIQMHSNRELFCLIKIAGEEVIPPDLRLSDEISIYKIMYRVETWLDRPDRDLFGECFNITVFRKTLEFILTYSSYRMYDSFYGKYIYSTLMIKWGQYLCDNSCMMDSEISEMRDFVRNSIRALKIFDEYGDGLIYMETPDFHPACVMARDAYMAGLAEWQVNDFHHSAAIPM